MNISFFVDGEPKAQPRTRAFSRGGITSVYDPGTANGWKALIAMAAKPHRPETPIDNPISLHVMFLMPRPKRLQTKKYINKPLIWHTSKPDLDNLIKAVMDSLTQIGFWTDDSRVFRQYLIKRYANAYERPGVLIQLDLCGDDD